MSESYLKITITIEEADGTMEVIEIPKGSHLRIDTRGIREAPWLDSGEPSRYSQQSTDLEIALTANFDDKEDCIIRRTRRTIGKDVKE